MQLKHIKTNVPGLEVEEQVRMGRAADAVGIDRQQWSCCCQQHAALPLLQSSCHKPCTPKRFYRITCIVIYK